MTEEQINKAIAKACGWNNQPVVRTNGRGAVWVTESPDYCNNLNAMHEAEEFLSGDLWTRYMTQLADIEGSLFGIRATARQRAEAFLMTLGKWEEVQG